MTSADVWRLVAAVVLLARREAAGKPPVGPTALPMIVGVLAVVAALATTVQVYRIGDSGAKAAWHDQVSATAHGDSDDK